MANKKDSMGMFRLRQEIAKERYDRKKESSVKKKKKKATFGSNIKKDIRKTARKSFKSAKKPRGYIRF